MTGIKPRLVTLPIKDASEKLFCISTKITSNSMSTTELNVARNLPSFSIRDHSLFHVRSPNSMSALSLPFLPQLTFHFHPLNPDRTSIPMPVSETVLLVTSHSSHVTSEAEVGVFVCRMQPPYVREHQQIDGSDASMCSGSCHGN